jgi:hypothetical protein
MSKRDLLGLKEMKGQEHPLCVCTYSMCIAGLKIKKMRWKPAHLQVCPRARAPSVCIYICVYLCVCICVCMCVCVCMYVCMYVCKYICTYVYKYLCMYVCICIYWSRSIKGQEHARRSSAQGGVIRYAPGLRFRFQLVKSVGNYLQLSGKM